MFGASPAEAPNEAWGIGSSLGRAAVVRYTDAGWTVAPPLEDATGAPLEGFSLAHPEAGVNSAPSPLAAQMTADGSGAHARLGEGRRQRTPGAARARTGGRVQGSAWPAPEAEAPAGEAGLKPGEELFGSSQAPMVAALDEEGGQAGALVVPGERTRRRDRGQRAALGRRALEPRADRSPRREQRTVHRPRAGRELAERRLAARAALLQIPARIGRPVPSPCRERRTARVARRDAEPRRRGRRTAAGADVRLARAVHGCARRRSHRC